MAKAKALVPGKKVSRQIKKLRKGLEEDLTLTKKVKEKTDRHAKEIRLLKDKQPAKKVKKQIASLKGKEAEHDKELDLLRKEVDALKKKKKRAFLSVYNRFMRTQIGKGLSFRQAAALWRKQKREEAKKAKKSNRSGYNIFISTMLKQGKTMKQAIAAWRRFKKGGAIRRRRPRPKPKPVISKARRKPKKIAKKRIVVKKKKPVKRRARPKPKQIVKIVRRVITRRVPVVRTVVRESISEEKIKRLIEEAISKSSESSEKRHSLVSETVSLRQETSGKEDELSDEEIALRTVRLYFEEIARLGFKRSLDLDQVINSYLYALSRVKRQEIEMAEIAEAVKKSKIRTSI